ncbi:MAG: leucine-rich repeat domain-containing protein, partial [Candidatus Nomurabacteria bacterium]|nr:leucine-rich repeat domain-containing protein [Candidatus Nomurabacteria bacterium]
MTIKPKHRPNSIRSALICVAALFGLAALLTTPYIISKFATATNTSAPIVDNDGVLAYGDSTYGGGAYAVLGCYNGAGGLTNTCPADINIPSTWNGHDVVEIADQAFEDKSGVDKLTTNNGLRYVGASAFADSAFTELSFASTVETYGSQAFFRMAHVKGVQLTINFANPSPAPATFGNDIMGWTWDGGLGTNLVINIPPTPAAWQAYLNASQSSDSANWQRVMTNAYTPPFPTVVVMNGSRGWCTPAQFGTTCYDNDGALPNIELYQSGTPVSPPPSVSDVNGNILAYSSLANGTYQIYGNSIDSGVELVVSGGQNSSAIVNFGPQLAVSAGAPL